LTPTPRQHVVYRRRHIREAFCIPQLSITYQRSTCLQSLVSPDTEIFAACYFIIGRRECLDADLTIIHVTDRFHPAVYTNSLLALLNSRNSTQRKGGQIHISIPLDLVKGSGSGTTLPTASVPGAKESAYAYEPDAKMDDNRSHNH
jgi:hypothetical protein